MLSTIIDASQSGADGGEGLARTIAALVPAIAEGVVRDGCIIGGEAGGPEEQIADAAGCDWIGGRFSAAMPQAVARSSGAWLLLLEAGCAPETGWWQEAGEFVSRSGMVPEGDKSAAMFSLADPRYSLAGRIAEWVIAARGIVTGRPVAAQGLIASHRLVESRLSDKQISRLPPHLPVRCQRLRARILASPAISS